MIDTNGVEIEIVRSDNAPDPEYPYLIWVEDHRDSEIPGIGVRVTKKFMLELAENILQEDE